MKRATLIISIITLSLVSCHKANIKPSGAITTENRSIGFFDKIEVQDAIDVDITQSTNNSEVQVETNSNLHQYIVTEIISNRLIIRLKNHINIRKNPTIKVHISVTDLISMDVSGASKIYLNNTFITNSLGVIASGASKFRGELQTNSLNVYASGASTVDFSGMTSNLIADLSGASTLIDFDMATDHLDIELSGASTARLTVNSLIDIKASGASTLYYEGSATINSIDLSGASQIKKN